MTCQNLNFRRTREEEQGIGSFLQLINLANLDDKLEPSWHLTYWLWSFFTSVWSIQQSSITKAFQKVLAYLLFHSNTHILNHTHNIPQTCEMGTTT